MKRAAKLSLTLCLMTFTSVSACSSAWGGTETINTGRADVELKTPDNYAADGPLPLVVLLHGYTSSGAGQDSYMKFSELVNEYGFLLLLPDGTVEKAGRKNRFWNATDACCDLQHSGVDDSTYLMSLIRAVKARYTVAANQIYLIGHSNGGFMSHRLAYDHPDTIAAIASLAGAAPANLTGPTPRRPVHILQIHGSDDATIKYAGGDIAGVRYPSASETMQMWARYNAGVSNQIPLDVTRDLDASIDGAETVVTHFEAASKVELWTIQAGGHVPELTANFNRQVIEWLFAHPKKPL